MSIPSLPGYAYQNPRPLPIKSLTQYHPVPQSNPVRFGWGNWQHGDINGSVAQHLPDSSLRDFLLQVGKIKELNRRSIFLDNPEDKRGNPVAEEPNGKCHFLNTEINAEGPKCHQTVLQPNMNASIGETQKALQTFDIDAADPFNNWHQVKTYKSGIPGKEANIVVNVFWAYQRLVGDFKSLKPDGRYCKASANLITEDIADLLHYSADLCQPLHLTINTAWQLKDDFTPKHRVVKPPSRNSHLFMEEIDPGKLQPLKPDVADLPSHKEIRKLLLKNAYRSYQGIGAIVEADHRLQESPLRGDAYLKSLSKDWKPLVTLHTNRATQLGRDLLWWAYLEAGKPDLSPLVQKRPLWRRLMHKTGRRLSAVRQWLQNLWQKN